MTKLMLALCAMAFLLPVAGQTQTTRVLIVGDSWAEEQWLDGSHARVFSELGLGQHGIYGDLTTESGSTAADWKQASYLQRIDVALASYPDIDTVQLTLGGNDFLADWNTGMSSEDVEMLQQWILFDLQIVVDHILGLDPDIEIILSFYDYPNFEDTRDGLIWTWACSGLWDDLGQPTPLQLNEAATDFIEAFQQLADTESRIHFVDHFGLMQNRFGFPDDNIEPGDLVMPGDLTRPSPLAAMRTRFFGGGHDCFHLNAAGYDFMVENLVENYFIDRLADRLADIALTELEQIYDGTPRVPDVTTDPSGLNHVITYDGTEAAPVDAGSYEVLVVIDQYGWMGDMQEILIVHPASQAITFELDSDYVYTDHPPISLEAQADSELTVEFSVQSGPATITDNVLTLDGQPGTIVVQASQSGDNNWHSAEPVQRSLQVIEWTDELFQDEFLSALPD
jgi:lysophospholipase L1-like esterase